MSSLYRLLRTLPLLIISPLYLLLSAVALQLSDFLFRIAGKRRPAAETQPDRSAASIVIPNWNGKDLLERYLPSVLTAAAGNPANEIIVVDNGSTDGSAGYVCATFPEVRLLALPQNLGFGGGSNAGFRAARNDIVVLLNSDMRVDPGFLQPLLDGFQDEKVFAVSCQIFFTDPDKLRQETGLTQGWWENGGLRVRHRDDPRVDRLYPCFYGGGGSCAFDRRKFLELGGFDPLFHPFYLEDTDLGYMAWKRGWKVLYQPGSVVYHEHRGTIGKRFTAPQIQAVLHKNFVLFCWKNIHEWPRLVSHLFFAYAGALVSFAFGDSPERPTLHALWEAFLQLPGALRARSKARSLAVISDTEAFRRPLGGYFRDRFSALPLQPSALQVLFVSPYPICPPIHGGAVFMLQTARHLATRVGLHLIVLLDSPSEQPPHHSLAAQCHSSEFLIRLEGQPREFGSILPHALHEYRNHDLEWAIHRQTYLHDIDVIQLEYLPMAQYAAPFHRIACFLFEHDIYFQSIGRALPSMRGFLQRASASYEYLRALRYELTQLSALDRVQVCTQTNKQYLTSFLPHLAPRIDPHLRAGIQTADYNFHDEPRQPYTILFVGSFRHLPNQDALQWFVHRVMPLILRRQPAAKLTIIGSDPPPRHSFPNWDPQWSGAIDIQGYVEDIRPAMASCAVFACPILSGSGVRVKLLEAFAWGIPVVSTTIGAEGLATRDGHLCALADTPATFAGALLRLFEDPAGAAAMAGRARAEVEQNWDIARKTEHLVDSYRDTLAAKRRAPAAD